MTQSTTREAEGPSSSQLADIPHAGSRAGRDLPITTKLRGIYVYSTPRHVLTEVKR